MLHSDHSYPSALSLNRCEAVELTEVFRAVETGLEGLVLNPEYSFELKGFSQPDALARDNPELARNLARSQSLADAAGWEKSLADAAGLEKSLADAAGLEKSLADAAGWD